MYTTHAYLPEQITKNARSKPALLRRIISRKKPRKQVVQNQEKVTHLPQGHSCCHESKLLFFIIGERRILGLQVQIAAIDELATVAVLTVP